MRIAWTTQEVGWFGDYAGSAQTVLTVIGPSQHWDICCCTVAPWNITCCTYSCVYLWLFSSLHTCAIQLTMLEFLKILLLLSGYPLPGYISWEASRWLVLSDELVQLGNENLRRNISVLHCDLSKNSFRLTNFVCYSIWIFTFISFLSIPEEAILGVFIDLGTGTSNTKRRLHVLPGGPPPFYT